MRGTERSACSCEDACAGRKGQHVDFDMHIPQRFVLEGPGRAHGPGMPIQYINTTEEKKPMDRRTFNKFREIVYKQSGISLGERKDALVSARVGKRMRALGMNDYRAYLKHVLADETGEEVVHLLNAISTNVTSFFREAKHFEFLHDIVSEWFAQGQRRFRLWSAACSTGEESYSLAMTFLETVNGQSTDMKILATDISTRALETCREGAYKEDKVKTIPPVLRKRYFEKQRHETGIIYTARPVLRKPIVFKRLNLSTPPFPLHGPFDVIFCRNVMIYFDNHVRKNLLTEMYRLLKDGGYLFVGHAESLTGMVSDFKSVKPSIYIKQ